MKKHTISFVVRMSLTVLLAAAAGILAISGYYWFAAVVCLALLWSFVDVLRRATRSVKDMKRLIDAIRFNELNISFPPAVKKGLPEELAGVLEESLAQFRHRLMQNAADQMFYDTLLQRIDSGIMVLNKHGYIEWINKTAVEMFGRPQPRELSDLEHVSTGMPAMLDELVPREVKLLTILKDGTPMSLAVSSTLFFANGKDFKLFSFKNIQSTLEEYESNAWHRLISVLTHEMMNSITPILSLSETLSDETAFSNETSHAVMLRGMQTIHRRSKGLIDFVKNYRKLTRIPEPFPVSIPVQEMLTDIQNLLSAEGIVFSYNIQYREFQLFADRIQMEQMLINLTKNAWDACHDTPHPKVEINVRKNEYQKPVIVVTDNGCGILPNVVEKIFIPFFTTKPGGSGIGLTICRQIMNLHRGSISVESEVGKGTKVTLRF